MQIIRDDSAYADLQQALLRTLAGDVRDTLREAAAGSASFDDAVRALTVKVATIIGGARELSRDGRPVRPVVMFGVADGSDEGDELIAGSHATRMHERALEAVEAVLAGTEPVREG